MSSELFDFLYSDHERVASFMSQIGGFGTLTGYERESDKTQENGGEGKVDLKVVGAKASSDTSWHRGIRETYDPLWRTSTSLVSQFGTTDDFDEHAPSVGQLVCLEGDLFCLDLAFVKGLMSAESMTEFIARGSSEDDQSNKRNRRNSIHKNPDDYKNAQVIVEYMKTIPLDVLFMLRSAGKSFSFYIKRDFLNLHQSDIPLKFPFQISGRWNVIGIVDASPEDQFAGAIEQGDELNSLFPALAQPFLTLIAMSAAMFGRNVSAYGISPLTIFRSVKVARASST